MSSSPEERYRGALDALSEAGITFLYVRGDLSSSEDRLACVHTAVARFGRVDALVNNAGVAPSTRTDLLDMTEESFDRVVGTNTKGTMFMTQAVARQMLTQEITGPRRGVIVNISSCSAVVSSTNRGEYCISKAGVSMLTTLFADRLAAERIYVFEVRPGVIATDMTAGVKPKYDSLIERGAFPIKRWGTPEDVANAVSVFCSDKFLYSTGNYLDVDGGFHIQRL
jgi:NAD(P)-dependent dehydrogenase (short-subunit alcohol dehydrogenase family)